MSAVEGWTIVELMGHRRLAGQVSEVEFAGSKLMRLDVPSEPPVTQFYGGGAIYCLTPTTEELAREMAQRIGAPQPVHRYELGRGIADDDDDDLDDDGPGF